MFKVVKCIVSSNSKEEMRKRVKLNNLTDEERKCLQPKSHSSNIDSDFGNDLVQSVLRINVDYGSEDFLRAYYYKTGVLQKSLS